MTPKWFIDILDLVKLILIICPTPFPILTLLCLMSDLILEWYKIKQFLISVTSPYLILSLMGNEVTVLVKAQLRKYPKLRAAVYSFNST